MIEFIGLISGFFSSIFAYDYISGLSLGTVFFFPFLLVLVYCAFTRRT